jgi:hypothetical protein
MHRLALHRMAAGCLRARRPMATTPLSHPDFRFFLDLPRIVAEQDSYRLAVAQRNLRVDVDDVVRESCFLAVHSDCVKMCWMQVAKCTAYLELNKTVDQLRSQRNKLNSMAESVRHLSLQ